MRERRDEWFVYSQAVDEFLDRGVEIVCACPPRGTDARFPGCRYPKPPGPAGKGGRDEVDITAATSQTLLMIEAKTLLSESLTLLNRANESDWEKLQRLLDIEEGYFLDRLSTAYDQNLTGLRRLPALAYHIADAPLPNGALGVHVAAPGVVRFAGLVPVELS